jgi:hypothetical protein
VGFLRKRRIVEVRYKPGKRKGMGSPFLSSPSLRVTVGYQWIIFGVPRPPRIAMVYKATASHGEERFAEDIDGIVKKVKTSYPWAVKKMMEFLKQMRQFPTVDVDTKWAD